jgi:coproporphyrinogen III oxidase
MFSDARKSGPPHRPFRTSARRRASPPKRERRGRTDQFNLLDDRGAVFGSKTGGNVDSTLSAVLRRVRWP